MIWFDDLDQSNGASVVCTKTKRFNEQPFLLVLCDSDIFRMNHKIMFVKPGPAKYGQSALAPRKNGSNDKRGRMGWPFSDLAHVAKIKNRKSFQGLRIVLLMWIRETHKSFSCYFYLTFCYSYRVSPKCEKKCTWMFLNQKYDLTYLSLNVS